MTPDYAEAFEGCANEKKRLSDDARDSADIAVARALRNSKLREFLSPDQVRRLNIPQAGLRSTAAWPRPGMSLPTPTPTPATPAAPAQPSAEK